MTGELSQTPGKTSKEETCILFSHVAKIQTRPHHLTQSMGPSKFAPSLAGMWLSRRSTSSPLFSGCQPPFSRGQDLDVLTTLVLEHSCCFLSTSTTLRHSRAEGVAVVSELP